MNPAPDKAGVAASRFSRAMKDNPDRGIKVRAVGGGGGGIRDFYHQLLRFTWPQLMLMFTLSFLAFNLLFAWLYMLDSTGISRSADPIEAPPFWQCFFFSVHTVATIGYGNVYPVSLYTNVLVVIEITLGVLFFALATGIAFARFSRPTARILFSEVAVVTEIDGVPTLMFRAANQRHNFVFEAHASLSILADELVGGSTMRRFRDLDLVRSSNPAFVLTWTIMHQIDADSPLRPWLSDPGCMQDAQIVVVLSGTDGRTGQTIYSRWLYNYDEVRFNSRFVDIIGLLDDGTRTIDYGRFHDVVPDVPPQASKSS